MPVEFYRLLRTPAFVTVNNNEYVLASGGAHENFVSSAKNQENNHPYSDSNGYGDIPQLSSFQYKLC